VNHLSRQTRIFSAVLLSTAFLFGTAQAQDVEEGAFVFDQQCSLCHSAGMGEAHKIGPNLYGVFGRDSGMADGYTYSAAMLEAGINWTEENLRTYLEGPAAMVPGTKMGFPGFSDPADEDNVIAYLESL